MPAPKAGAGPIKVLLVEDHLILAESFAALLKRDPLLEVVGIATTAREALALATTTKPDIVLMDIRLPDGSGVDTAIAIRRTATRTSFIFLTAYDSAETLWQAVEAGGAAFSSQVGSVRNGGRGDQTGCGRRDVDCAGKDSGRAGLAPRTASPGTRAPGHSRLPDSTRAGDARAVGQWRHHHGDRARTSHFSSDCQDPHQEPAREAGGSFPAAGRRQSSGNRNRPDRQKPDTSALRPPRPAGSGADRITDGSRIRGTRRTQKDTRGNEGASLWGCRG